MDSATNVQLALYDTVKKSFDEKWAVGFRDRGHGHGDFAVITKKTRILLVECAYEMLAEHIVQLHNKSLTEK